MLEKEREEEEQQQQEAASLANKVSKGNMTLRIKFQSFKGSKKKTSQSLETERGDFLLYIAELDVF